MSYGFSTGGLWRWSVLRLLGGWLLGRTTPSIDTHGLVCELPWLRDAATFYTYRFCFLFSSFFCGFRKGYTFTLSSRQIHSNSANERKNPNPPGFRNSEKKNHLWCFSVSEKGPCLPSNSLLLYHLSNESSAHNGSTLQKRPNNLNML